jgi:short-subunit dehydrogenase
VILLEPQPVHSKFFDHGVGPDIATDAYESLKKRIAEEGKKSYRPGARNVNTPEDLAAIITKAALSANPKARYRIGTQKMMYWMHALMPDRMLDRLFARQIGEKE